MLPIVSGAHDASLAALAHRLTDDLSNYVSRVGLFRIVTRQAAAGNATAHYADNGTIDTRAGLVVAWSPPSSSS